MTEPAIVIQPVTCAGCGDKVDSVDENDGRGPCCHNLPNPWHRGISGLYDQTSRSQNARYEDDEEEEEIEDERPRCECGSMDFRVTGTQHSHTRDNEREEGCIYIDSGDFGDLEVSCRECNARVHFPTEWM